RGAVPGQIDRRQSQAPAERPVELAPKSLRRARIAVHQNDRRPRARALVAGDGFATDFHGDGFQGCFAVETPRAMAASMTAARFSSASLARMLSMCFSTVRRLMARMSAISGLDLPWASQPRTSRSRAVN